MEHLKAYLDTNILIEYCWIAFFSEKKRKSTAYSLVEKGSRGEYEIYISFYTLMEIWQHFSDYYLQQRAIRDGFSYRQFSQVRQDYELTKEELNTVSELVQNLRKSEYLNYIEPYTKDMGDKFFNVIMEYVRGYVDFYDALHIRTAIDVECKYFVTKDSELRKRLQHLISNNIIEEPIQITSVTGFLQLLKTREF